MSTTADKHAPEISGLNKLYDTLTAMRHVCPNDIKPPHSPEAISDEPLQSLAFEPEAVELIRLLSFLLEDVAWGQQKNGTEILPRSKAVSYLTDRSTNWVDSLRWGDLTMSSGHKLLPPWMLRLTIGQMYPGQYGTDLIYDCRMRMCMFFKRRGFMF